MNHRISIAVISISLGIVNIYASAATPPDAGVLRQQIEREEEQKLPSPSKAEIGSEEPTAPLKTDSSLTVTVSAFRFVGNTLISGEQLAQSVSRYLNRPVSFNELNQAVAEVGKTYRQAGWVVKVYLPQQEINEGVVAIRVVEAVYGGARQIGSPATHVLPSQVLNIFNQAQKRGEFLNSQNLDRALMLADDLPGVVVKGTLNEGENYGETDLLVETANEPLISGRLLVDNFGSRSTGEERAILSASFNSPLKIGDRVDAHFLTSKGSDFAMLNYSLPVGSDGWRVGITGTYLQYELVADEFDALNGEGDSTSFGLNATYPVLRGRLQNIYFDSSYSNDNYHNEANGFAQSDYRIDRISAGFSGNIFDNYSGGGSTNWSLIWTYGYLELNTLELGESPSLEGDFNRLRVNLSRQQVLTEALTLSASITGQFSHDNLDSSQRFYLGGPAGVRAYPVSEASGSRGQLANLELFWRLPYYFKASVFYDWGHVGNADSSPSYNLKGYGVGVLWQPLVDLSINAMLARRDGDNPNPTSSGKDQDGSLDRNRFWLTASYLF